MTGSGSRESRPSPALPAAFALLRRGPDGTGLLDGAIRVFGDMDGELRSIASWNDPSAWVGEYNGLADGLAFFAEDSFGNQFGWDGSEIHRLAAESGARSAVCRTPRDWWQLINDDPDTWAVAWLFDAWKKERGPVGLGSHLAPRIPFVLGSEVTVDSLFVIDRWDDMSFKASLATQLRDVPAGGKVRFRFED